jgi:hypothetical protein
VSQRTILADLQESLPRLRRISALAFAGGLVETDGWLASHLGPTPTTITDEPSGIVFLADGRAEGASS